MIGAPGAEAAHPLGCLSLQLCPGLGCGVVMDMVVVNVPGCRLAHQALGTQERAAGSSRGAGRGQPAPGWKEGPVQLLGVVGGAGTRAVAAQTWGLAAGGLEDPGQVVIQDCLWVILIAARGQEAKGVLGCRRLPGAGRRLRALLFILEGSSRNGGGGHPGSQKEDTAATQGWDYLFISLYFILFGGGIFWGHTQ